jgi:cell wall-associated NlpC family hydrolase
MRLRRASPPPEPRRRPLRAADGAIPTEAPGPGTCIATEFRDTYYSAGEPVTQVGIYVGDGEMINAPVEGKPISLMPVFTGFWGEHVAGGGRPVGRS